MPPTSPLPTSGLRALLGRGAARRGAPLPSPRSEWEDSEGADSLVGEALRYAEQRRALAEQIVIELVQHPGLREAPEVVQDFLLQVWPLVMAHARLSSPMLSEDPGGEQRLVDELLWSVRRESALRRPRRLVELVPGLLQRLRQGLALLGREPQAFDAFFQALEQLHQPALQLCAMRRQGSAGGPALMPSGPLGPAPAPAEAPFAWQPGTWVDLYSGQRWLRARLDWVDPQGRHCLFSSQGGRLHTMTRRILERLLREGLLRPATAA